MVCKQMKSIDFYSTEVKLTFQNEQKYKTWVGSTLSTITVVLFLGLAVMNTLKLVSREDNFLSTHTMIREDTFPIDLAAIGYQFAVTALDPRVGEIEVLHTAWG